MLKTHFSASQFIVVSLKEGMFNNANVIYRTKFVDGVSAVGRTANRSTAAPAASGGGGGGGGGREAATASKGRKAARTSAGRSSAVGDENAQD